MDHPIFAPPMRWGTECSNEGWDTKLAHPIKVGASRLVTLRDIRIYISALAPVHRSHWGTVIVRLIQAAEDPCSVRVALAEGAARKALAAP